MNHKLEKLLIATHNSGKAKELAQLMAPLGIAVVSAKELNLAEPEETGNTFQANAKLKSTAAAMAAGIPALADDSGLEVTALGGDPGIYSARWAGYDKNFALAMGKIETLLTDKADKAARFVCVLSLAWPDGRSVEFTGLVNGEISFPMRGDKGFGYDPIFVPQGYSQTFAEMEPDFKQKISHRADAFNKFLAFLSRN